MISSRIKDFLLPGFRSLFSPPKNQIPALDGLRSLAILLVVATHSTASFSKLGGQPNFLSDFRLLTGGWVGVDLFFILSGFFIGKQLWQELVKTGKINFISFILRRGLRIWPLYFAVLGITYFCFWWVGKADAPLWPELLLVSNYFGVHYIGGSWSLATEEQFYIFIPTFLIILSYFTRSLHLLRWVMLGVLMVLPLIRAWVVSQTPESGLTDLHFIVGKLYEPFHTHSDPLIFGMILSNIFLDTQFRQKLAQFSPLGVFIGLTALGVVLRRAHLLIFEYTFLALMFGGLAWYCLQVSPKNWLIRVMSWRGFYLISKLSYGMYLLHQYVMNDICEWTLRAFPSVHPALQFTLFSTINLGVAMVSAALGVILIEHPFLRMRGRMGFGGAH